MTEHIQYPKLTNESGQTVDLFPPAFPKNDQAAFVASPLSWDGLGSVSISDEMFETDSGQFRAELAKIQYAPRLLTITGIIRTPKTLDPQIADYNRTEYLHKIYAVVGALGNLSLTFDFVWPTPQLVSAKYVLYCHLHGSEAVKVLHHTDTEYYKISISLIAEDPLIYYASAVSFENTVTNIGDVPHYASIRIDNCRNLLSYTCRDNTTGVEQTVQFHAGITGNLEIRAQYPGQIMSIKGTTLDNIDTRGGKPMFPQVPVGQSTWTRGDNQGDVVVYVRHPKIGVAP